MKKVKAAFRGIVIFLLCMIEIYPLFWMLTASFKKQAEWSEKPAYALNDGFYFQNYSDAWTRGHMSTFFKNSLITTLVALVFIVFFSVTVGFAVTKMKWKFRNAVAQYFRFGIMIPVAIALIPLFQIYSKTNLLNTRICLIITYIAFGLSLSIYLVQGYLRSFPDDIMEAAVIDGCGIYRLMWHIVTPLMKNSIVTVLVLQFFFEIASVINLGQHITVQPFIVAGKTADQAVTVALCNQVILIHGFEQFHHIWLAVNLQIFRHDLGNIITDELQLG